MQSVGQAYSFINKGLVFLIFMEEGRVLAEKSTPEFRKLFCCS
jgi:hypothetical protein